MKVGDLISVVDSRACGGRPRGTVGLVVEELREATGCQNACWNVAWVSEIAVSWGRGIEVISESR